MFPSNAFPFVISLIISSIIRSGYSSENSQNSQVKFALKAANGNKVCCFGLSCTDGALLITAARDEETISESHEMSDKRTFPLLQGTRVVLHPVKHLFRIDKTLSVALTGIPSDCRHMLGVLRRGAQDYRLNFGEPIPAVVLADQASAYLHDLTLGSDTRPLAVTVLIAARANQDNILVDMVEDGVETPSLGGEIVKITCDGSYDFYYCCRTDSAHSLDEEPSLTLKLQDILWSSLSIVDATAKLQEVLRGVEIEETEVDRKGEESSIEGPVITSIKTTTNEILTGSVSEQKIKTMSRRSYSILEVMKV